MEKITKREKFMMVGTLVSTVGENLLSTDDKAMLLEFVEHELELLDKKKANAKTSPKKQTERQKENEMFETLIFDTLVALDKPCTVTEIILNTPQFVENHISTQRLAPILKTMKEKRLVEKEDKSKTWMAIAS